MYGKFQKHLQDELAAIEAAGLYKHEREICSAQELAISYLRVPQAERERRARLERETTR